MCLRQVVPNLNVGVGGLEIFCVTHKADNSRSDNHQQDAVSESEAEDACEARQHPRRDPA